MIVSAINMGAAGDPLFVDGVSWAVIGIVALKVLVTFVVMLIATMFMVWFERKVISDMQNRIGPNRAGPFGLLQTLADGMKLFMKENLFPSAPTAKSFALLLISLLFRPFFPSPSCLLVVSSLCGATTPAFSWPTRPSAFCGSSLCRRYLFTESCSPVGLPALNIRCSGRFVLRLRWLVTKRRSVCLSQLLCL